MKIDSHHLTIKSWLRGASPLASLQASITQACGDSVTPLRVAVVGKNSRGHLCEVEAVDHASKRKAAREKSIFAYRQRGQARTGAFNAVMLIPTGVDCAIGGHAGDATPAARLLASVCDNLVLHPNVVNASDINEQADNCLYTEGSLICRLMMGTIGLQKIRQNRVLLVTEERPDAPNVVDQTINCAEGARQQGADAREPGRREIAASEQEGESGAGALGIREGVEPPGLRRARTHQQLRTRREVRHHMVLRIR